MLIRFAVKAHSGFKNRNVQTFWVVWMIAGPESRYSARKVKIIMFGLHFSFIRLVKYSFVNLLNTRFLYMPRLGCMVFIIFGLPKHVLGDDTGECPFG
ncbi:hypothetical protein HanRHA438_Chr08g0367251 [Helianthus annuus]|uniref:Uncharacterized protein n=1 Tax=Helianthus annuus TaxID=4232 RepID=A0A9K3NE15_HELAN|nr:hypothetical protein HanXRQr2_Chr08g0355221 [Helianthus annuus]KAJ0548391.1 hypothetical protein HanIR_Chr08g0383231 [Helianthus annuus]KAJ0899327.1 hypothetical protein HanRHA438_Chr08g0367251 [Helianthus annuus]KAJ0902920.1 hypothetical protein HanPSC8_Chr08g0342951 [Helianthus annuus]